MEGINKISFFCIAMIFSLFHVTTASAVINDGFDFPVGIPDHAGWSIYPGYGFLGNDHLGEDWNMSEEDEGEPVYAIANGIVINDAEFYYSPDPYPDDPNKGGWGHLVMIKHDLSQRFPDSPYKYVVSLYAHLGSTDLLKKGDYVRRGEQIGVIGGSAENGGWGPHLHFELRSEQINSRFGSDTYIGCGYLKSSPCNITDPAGWLDPSAFITAHRPSPIPISGDWTKSGSSRTGIFTPGTTGSSGHAPTFSLDGGTPIYFGQAGDYPIIGDWDGDGIDNIGLFRLFRDHAVFYLDSHNDGGPAADKVITFNYPQDLPIAGDWDGDGIDEIGGYLPDNSTFYLYKISGSTAVSYGIPVPFGLPGDIPIIGDWNGDGKDEVGIFRAKDPNPAVNPNTNWFHIYPTQTGNGPYSMGNIGDLPIIGDWGGDGVDNLGVYRPSTQEFFFGPNPVSKRGDLNGDGRIDVIDLGIFLSNWGATSKPPSDINQDGRVDVIDLGILLSNWGY